jgi:hypothetical protein
MMEYPEVVARAFRELLAETGETGESAAGCAVDEAGAMGEAVTENTGS